MRTRQGFTITELLIAMVVFVIILGGALSFLTAQQRMFQKGSDAMGVLQNLSYGSDNLYAQIRTAGGNTPDQQPPVVYAGPNSLHVQCGLHLERRRPTSSPSTSIRTHRRPRSRRSGTINRSRSRCRRRRSSIRP